MNNMCYKIYLSRFNDCQTQNLDNYMPMIITYDLKTIFRPKLFRSHHTVQCTVYTLHCSYILRQFAYGIKLHIAFLSKQYILLSSYCFLYIILRIIVCISANIKTYDILYIISFPKAFLGQN